MTSGSDPGNIRAMTETIPRDMGVLRYGPPYTSVQRTRRPPELTICFVDPYGLAVREVRC